MNSTDDGRTKQIKALIISTSNFGGFHRENDRWQLGWFVLSTVPRDIEDQLKHAVDVVESLKAQIALVKVEAEEKVEQAEKERGALKGEVSRLSTENDHLRALMERVSSGVR